MKRLAILGSSGHGKVIADAALAAGWEEVVFFDDQWPNKQFAGYWPVIGDSAALLGGIHRASGVIVGIGDCAVRAAKHATLRDAGLPIVSIVHPRSWVSPRARIGIGSIIVAGAVVNVDAVLGEACIVNTGATVDHDCVLGFSVHVAPGANISGDVIVGDRSWIGVGACVKQGLRIGADVMIGAGSVVVRAVPDSQTVFGSPAKTH